MDDEVNDEVFVGIGLFERNFEVGAAEFEEPSEEGLALPNESLTVEVE